MKPIPPKARLASMLIATTAVFVLNHWSPLIIVLSIILVLVWRSGILPDYARFAVFFWVPTAVMLLIIWGLITRAPPGAIVGTDPKGGLRYATTIALRILAVGGIVQLAILSIPSRLLPATLRGWGLRGESLVVALGAFAAGPELALRVSQIVIARQSRGLMS